MQYSTNNTEIMKIKTLIFRQIKLRTVDMEQTPPNNAQPHVHDLIKANFLFTEEFIMYFKKWNELNFKY